MLRTCVVLLLAMGLVAVTMSLSAVGGNPPALNAGGVDGTLDLKAQLEKGLKARRPVEFQYIAAIIQLVDEGKLPRSLVDSSFNYARKKRSRALQYFQFTLDARAKPLGIVLPRLDNQAVVLN